MADEPKLVVALEARLDRFEKQLRQAGLIAEREMKALEDRTSSIAIGTALGGAIQKGIEKAIKSAIDEIKEAIELTKELGSTAQRTAVSFEEIQRIGGAAAMAGISQTDTLKALNSVSTNMEQMNRRETELSNLLEANNIKFKDRNGLVLDGAKGMELAAQLMAKAGNQIEKEEIARIFGLTADWVKVLGKGVDRFREMKEAANVNPELEKAAAGTAALFKMVTAITAEFKSWGTELAAGLVAPLVTFANAWANINVDLAKLHENNFLGPKLQENALAWTRIAASINEIAEDLERTKFTVTPKPTGVTWPQTQTGDKDALTKQNEQLAKHIALLKAEGDTIGKTIAEQEQARQKALLIEAAIRAGAKDQAEAETRITDQMRQQVDKAGELAQKLAERRAQWNEMVSVSREFGSLMSDAMKGLVLEGKRFDEVLKNITNRIASKAFDKLFDVLFAAPSGGGGSIFMQLLGIKAPGRMAGGPVTAGAPFMVGERGPELFVPNRSGMIVPNSTLRGGSSGDVNVGSPVTNIRIDGSADRSTIAAMQQMLAARDRRFVADVASASRELRRRSVRV